MRVYMWVYHDSVGKGGHEGVRVSMKACHRL